MTDPRVIDSAANTGVRLVHVLRRHQARRIHHELRVALVALPLRASQFYIAEAPSKGARCVEVWLKHHFLTVSNLTEHGYPSFQHHTGPCSGPWMVPAHESRFTGRSGHSLLLFSRRGKRAQRVPSRQARAQRVRGGARHRSSGTLAAAEIGVEVDADPMRQLVCVAALVLPPSDALHSRRFGARPRRKTPRSLCRFAAGKPRPATVSRTRM